MITVNRILTNDAPTTAEHGPIVVASSDTAKSANPKPVAACVAATARMMTKAMASGMIRTPHPATLDRHHQPTQDHPDNAAPSPRIRSEVLIERMGAVGCCASSGM